VRLFSKTISLCKIVTARQLQQEIGGEIVFFFHDSDHDPRETITSCENDILVVNIASISDPELDSEGVLASLCKAHSSGLAFENGTAAAKLR